MTSKVTCEFCNHQFMNHIILKNHMATAKYCLKLRPNAEANKFSCEHCGKKFAQKAHLRTHSTSCKSQKIMSIEKYKSDLDQKIKEVVEISQAKTTLEHENIKLLKELDQEKDNNCDLEIRLEKQNKRIRKLEIELAMNKGQIVGMKASKTPKIINNTNNYINPKLANLPTIEDGVQPLTIEYVKSLADTYTYAYFKQGPVGIANFINSFVTTYDEDDLDAPPKRSYACTDVPRHKFHKLGLTGWKLDMGAKFIGSVFNQIKNKANEHYSTLTDECLNEDDEYDKKIKDEMRLNFIFPMVAGINDKNGVKRDQLITEVRTYLRPMVTV